MAHSLEARVPFLDREVAALALALPRAARVRGFSKKRLLRRAVEPLLPREVVHGRKQGFSIPATAWLRGELAPFAREVLDRRGAPAGVLRPGGRRPPARAPHLGRRGPQPSAVEPDLVRALAGRRDRARARPRRAARRRRRRARERAGARPAAHPARLADVSGPDAPELGIFVARIAAELERPGPLVERVVIDRRRRSPLTYAALVARATRAARSFRPDVVYGHMLFPAGWRLPRPRLRRARPTC